MSFIYNQLIKKNGMDIKIKKRIETLDSDGNVTFTYNDALDSKAWIVEIGPIREEFLIVGYTEPIDYIGMFKHDEDINIGDIVVLDDDTETEVREVFKRRRISSKIAYRECVLIKIEG